MARGTEQERSREGQQFSHPGAQGRKERLAELTVNGTSRKGCKTVIIILRDLLFNEPTHQVCVSGQAFFVPCPHPEMSRAA